MLVVVAAAVISRFEPRGESPTAARQAGQIGCHQVATDFREKDSGSWVTMSGHVERVLTDEQGTSTHQRFILRCASSTQTVLIVNNVDVGERAPVSIGKVVVADGQYIWNRDGGLMHDTHHSTDSNPNGWIYVSGRVYQ